LVVVRNDHNILFYELENLQEQKQLVGFNDEILDLKYSPESQKVFVASNSEQVRIFDLPSFACQTLSGHSGIVLSVDVSHDSSLIASAGKDHTVRVWDANTLKCLAVCTGHNEAVGAISFPKKTHDFLLSGSKDRTLKCWDLASLGSNSTSQSPAAPKTKFTEIGHEKDINCIAFAPNDSVFASASQDKLVKLWTTATMKNRGVLKGHKRGVWSVDFSPVDKCVATASADNTIKVWSVTEFTCLKTFEGHTASVLQVAFVTAGMQLASVGGDGLLKLWTIKTNECVNTFDEHEDKIWAMAICDGEIITGGADSFLHIWKDVTSEENEQAKADEEEKILINQELDDARRNGEYVKAAQLALKLNHPFEMRCLLHDLTRGGKDEDVCQIIRGLDNEELATLLGFVRDWNCHAKYTDVAQRTLAAVFECVSPTVLKTLPNIKEMFEALLPYSERHAQRLSGLLRQSYFVDYVVQSMAYVPIDDAENNAPKKQKIQE